MERVNSVNAFHIKRQAHAVSRREASLPSDRWNPFRHVWAKSHRRTQTWDPEALTGANPPDPDEDGTSPIEQVHTAPAGSHRDFGEDANGRTSKEGEANGFPPERIDSSHDTAVNSQATADSTGIDASGVRNRKSERPLSTPTSGQEDEAKKPKKDHRLFKNVQPKEPFTFANQFQRTLLNSWINVLLVAAPVGIILGVIPNMNQYAIFVVNFVAIIPLAAMLSFATEEIALRTGETLGGLLNASFGYVGPGTSVFSFLLARQP